MKATIRTLFPSSAEKVWQYLRQPQTLPYISAPWLRFKSTDLPDEWISGRTYLMDLYLFSIIPLGKHRITPILVDQQNLRIESQESNRLSPVWNHTISLESLDNNLVQYTDEVDIQAGILTPIVWGFAQLFYRHRQRKWKKLLAKL